MKDNFSKTLYVIKWNSDHQTIITSGWQINAIRHSEKKWYNGESQMREKQHIFHQLYQHLTN